MSRSLSYCAVAALVLTVGVARAQAPAPQSCVDTATLPNPVYLTIGDTQVNLIKQLGAKLRAESRPITLVWNATGSCTNLEAIYSNGALPTNLSYIPAGFDPKTTPPTCATPQPTPADVANSIVFLDTCPSTRPPEVVDFTGPVQSFVFVAPSASSQTAITYEEAYFVWGFGMQGMVSPWLSDKSLYARLPSKGTIISIGASIDVPAARWVGAKIDKSTDLATMLGADPNYEAALGILGTEVYDQYHSSLKQLAFRAKHQYHAYFPDSTATAKDKINVRDGHYHMWSYTHWLLHVDPSSGKPVNDLAKYVVDLIVGNDATPKPSFEPVDLAVGVGLIPQCAMRVQRSSEGGDFSLFSAAEPCACYFEKAATGKTSCAACSDTSPCASGVCRRGVCEAK